MNDPVIPIEQVPVEKPSVWDRIVAFGRGVLRWLVGPGAALVVIVVAIVLVALGVKNVQIGGILGKIFGKKGSGKTAIDVANTVPEDRVDENGNLIPIGKPDEKGFTQTKVVAIDNPGLFSNPDSVTFNHDGKKVEVDLPKGVKAKDVDKVIVVSPDEFAVTVKDSSGVSGKEVDDLLKKYGG